MIFNQSLLRACKVLWHILLQIVDGFRFRLHQLAGAPLGVSLIEELHVHLWTRHSHGTLEVRDDNGDSKRHL